MRLFRGSRLVRAIFAVLPIAAIECAVAAAGTSDLPTVRMNIFQPNPSITAPMDVEIELLNLTSRSYDVDSVYLHVPESLRSIRPNFDNVIIAQTHTIDTGAELIYVKGLPRADMPPWEALTNQETLLFTPGTYRFRAEVIIKDPSSRVARSIYATHELELEPPLSAPLRGGIIGALLLALFVPAYRALLGSSQQGLLETAKQFTIYFFSGAVVSITAILILYRLGSANLPISITVNDYLGGVIVGLFSYVFGNALYAQFFQPRSDESVSVQLSREENINLRSDSNENEKSEQAIVVSDDRAEGGDRSV